MSDDDIKPNGEHPGLFDRFAERVDAVVSAAWFFAFSVGLCVGWLPTWFLVKDLDTWQLLINTPTTVLTFLLVGLAANSTRRSSKAVAKKQNAVAEGLADLMAEFAGDYPKLTEHCRELRKSVGLELREDSS